MLTAGGSHEVAGTRPTRESVTSASSVSSINAAATTACKVQRHELKHHSLWSTKLEVQEKFLPDPSQFQVSVDVTNIYCVFMVYTIHTEARSFGIAYFKESYTKGLKCIHFMIKTSKEIHLFLSLPLDFRIHSPTFFFI